MLRVLTIGAVLAATPSLACSPADFTVTHFKIGAKNDCHLTPCPVLTITGLLKNNCAQPAGAQVKLTALDEKGDVLGTSENWPASIKNIAPGRTWAFDLGWSIDFNPAIKRIDWEVVDAKTW